MLTALLLPLRSYFCFQGFRACGSDFATYHLRKSQSAYSVYDINNFNHHYQRRNLIKTDISTFIQHLERSILLAYKVLELITNLEIKVQHSVGHITPIALKNRKIISFFCRELNKTWPLAPPLPLPPHKGLGITKRERGTWQNEIIPTSPDFSISFTKFVAFSCFLCFPLN